MTDTVRALENAEERIEEFKASVIHPNLVVDTIVRVKRTECIVTCPACNKQINAVAWDGVVKGYCTNARKFVTINI